MRIRYGYNIEMICEQDLPLVTLLDIHPSRRHDILVADELNIVSLRDPSLRIAAREYIDQF